MGSVTLNLKYKLIAVFFIVCLLPISVISYINYNELKTNIANLTKNNLEAIALLKSTEIQRFFKRKVNDINTISTSPCVRGLLGVSRDKNKVDKNTLKQMAKEQLHKFILPRDIDEVYIFMPDKTELLAIKQRDKGIKFLDEAFEVGKTKLFFSKLYKGYDNNQTALFTMSMPITDDNNQTVGVIVAEVVFDKFFNQIQDYTGLGSTGETLIGAKMGNEIVFLNSLKYDQNASMTRKIILGTGLGLPMQKAVTGDIGSGLSTDYRGASVLAAWRHIEVANWGLVAKIDTKEVFEASNEAKYSILSSAVILLLFLAFLVALSTKIMLIPVKQTEKYAFVDLLTELPNRRFLSTIIDDVLDNAKNSNALVAVLFLDLDGFKVVNDTYGHEIGDKLLQSVARRLLASVEPCDTVARLAGDEFVILLTEAQDAQNIEKVADNIVKTVNESYQIDGLEICVGTSIGISIYPKDAADFDNLIKKADSAMYLAKKAGRNSYKFA